MPWDTLIPSVLSGVIVGGVIAYVNWRQLDRQTKIDSARLILSLDKLTLRSFQKLFWEKSNAQFPADVDDIHDVYLGRMDMICMFHEDGLIDDLHMEQQYDLVIRKCCENKGMVKRLRDKNVYYAALKRRMERLQPNIFDSL